MSGERRPARAVVAWRIGWTIGSLVVAQVAICAVAAAPPVLVWRLLIAATTGATDLRWILATLTIVPTYVLFAGCLMIVSPLATRALGWRTPADATMRIADMGWDLLRWVRYGASIHLVRIISGTLFRGTPLWTFHLRLSGARCGRRVYVNSLALNDYNLIECGDDVVVGAAVQLSGHTVEDGVVKTARLRIGDGVTIGLGSVIEIGVSVGARARIGALSFVPKYATLESGRTYVGTPAAPLDA